MTRFAPVFFAHLAFVAVLETTATPAHAEPRTHDGFQFRGDIGGGYLSDSESASSGSGTVSGGAIGFELYAGGNVIPGLAIGGLLGGASAPGPSVSANGQTFATSNSTTLTLAYLGPYIDWYIDPTGGFHIMGMLELTRLSVQNGAGNVAAETPVGGGLGAGVGYDFWLGDSFSMGLLGRINFSSNSYTADPNNASYTDKTVNPMLLLSFSYH